MTCSSAYVLDKHQRLLAQLRRALVSFPAAAALIIAAGVSHADETPVERGKYLVTFGGCNDCHTPGYFFGKPDMARMLGGSEVGFEIPGLGVFHGPNLTPDPEPGLGKWSSRKIATAITTGNAPMDACLRRSCRGTPSPNCAATTSTRLSRF